MYFIRSIAPFFYLKIKLFFKPHVTVCTKLNTLSARIRLTSSCIRSFCRSRDRYVVKVRLIRDDKTLIRLMTCILVYNEDFESYSCEKQRVKLGKASARKMINYNKFF